MQVKRKLVLCALRAEVMITELVIHTFFDYHGLLAFAGVGTSTVLICTT